MSEDRSAGRWCAECRQHGSHHTDRHAEFVTADHPTRTPDQGSEVPARQRAAEERYTAVLAAHQRILDGPGSCRCGAWPPPEHDVEWPAHVAAALVAADPAAAQPDAGLNDGEALAIVKRACDIECQSPGKHTQCSSHEPYRVLREALLRDALAARAARAAQPVPAPEVSRGVAEHHVHEWQVEYLPDPMSAGSVVRSGDLRCSCGETVRDALPADDGADCCRERTTAGGCGCGRSGEGESL